MKVSDLKLYIESQVPYKYVMNYFHTQTPDDCVAVLLGSSGRTMKNISSLQFQFLVRSADPELAENVAKQIFDHFNNKTDYKIADTKVVLSRGRQAVPIYTGMDEADRHIYSVNIDAIVDIKN